MDDTSPNKQEAEKNKEYQEFVDKFKPKKTTDDCYTPPVVYEAIKDWAVQDRHWEGRPIVRPFWPGGDYESYDYPDGCVVIDNPPFSCISKIVHWYEDKGIDFFLFAPHLTCLGIRARSTIGINADIIYDNGACVSTSFVPRLRTAPDLHNIIEAAAKKARKEQASAAVQVPARSHHGIAPRAALQAWH